MLLRYWVRKIRLCEKKNSVPFNNERWGFEKSKKNELSYL